MAASIDAVVRCSKAPPGAQKVTKVQIAARYALSAYAEMADHLGEASRRKLKNALPAVSHIR